MTHVPQEFSPARDLVECVVCGRSFVEERIKIHESICQKTLSVSRKSFDISQQRIRGTDAEKFAKTAAKKECLNETQKNKPLGLLTNWRRKHLELKNKIKAAKELVKEKKPKANDLPFPPPTTYDGDYVQCQHCLRLYNQISAARHIVTCARRMCDPKSKTNEATSSAPTTSEVNMANE